MFDGGHPGDIITKFGEDGYFILFLLLIPPRQLGLNGSNIQGLIKVKSLVKIRVKPCPWGLFPPKDTLVVVITLRLSKLPHLLRMCQSKTVPNLLDIFFLTFFKLFFVPCRPKHLG